MASGDEGLMHLVGEGVRGSEQDGRRGVPDGAEEHWLEGRGGVKVRVTDLLCKVKTEEEAIEYSCAFIQLYREEARYLERTAPWIERVGIDHIKEKLLANPDNRRALHARFLYSQKFWQIDPWAERARAARDIAEFRPMAVVSR